jgi:hypothetical protein
MDTELSVDALYIVGISVDRRERTVSVHTDNVPKPYVPVNYIDVLSPISGSFPVTEEAENVLGKTAVFLGIKHACYPIKLFSYVFTVTKSY